MGENLVQKKPIRGVRIRTFNACMIALSSVLFIFIIYNISAPPKLYHTLAEHTDEYIACEKDASMLKEASDYLTEQVRLYAQNMDIQNMQLYFEEANVTRRRENALVDLEKLVSVANGYSDDVLPQEVCSL